MKSITQIQHELDGQTLISNFFRLIGLGKICKAVNFNRSSSVSLASIIAWLFEARFNRYSMYRAKESVNFTSRTARNVMNDGRINWQKLLIWSIFRRWVNSAGAYKRYQCRQIITKSLKLTCKWWLKRLSLRQFNQIRLFSIEYYNLSLVRLDFFIN